MRWAGCLLILALLAARLSAAPLPRVDPNRACVDCVDPQLLALLPAEIRYQRSAVQDSDNGFVALTRAVATMSMATEQSQGERADSWVANNRVALELIDAALAAPGFQLPLWDAQTKWPPYRDLARLKVARARQRIAQSDYEGAANDVADVFILSQRMLAGDPLLLTHLISLSIERIALDGIRRLSAERAIPASLLDTLAHLLQAAPPLCASYDLALRVEATTYLLPQLVGGDISTPDARLRHVLKMSQGGNKCRAQQQCVQALSHSVRSSPSAFDPADTVHVAARLVAYGMGECPSVPARRHKSTDKIFGPPPVLDGFVATIIDGERRCTTAPALFSFASDAPVVNPIGRCWLRRPQWAHYPTRSQAERNVTLIMLAARTHEIQTGELPLSLDALSAKNGSALPNDPFADSPFRYDRRDRTLGSVGEDGVNGIVAASDDARPADDLAWTIPSPN